MTSHLTLRALTGDPYPLIEAIEVLFPAAEPNQMSHFRTSSALPSFLQVLERECESDPAILNANLFESDELFKQFVISTLQSLPNLPEWDWNNPDTYVSLAEGLAKLVVIKLYRKAIESFLEGFLNPREAELKEAFALFLEDHPLLQQEGLDVRIEFGRKEDPHQRVFDYLNSLGLH